MEYGRENMVDLAWNRLTIPEAGTHQEEVKAKECIVHIIAGKANLVIGADGGQQWRYPLDTGDTVWIPPETHFRLQNDGIGTMEVSRYVYSAS